MIQKKQQGNDRTVAHAALATIVVFLTVFFLTANAHVTEGQVSTVTSGTTQMPSVTLGEEKSYQALLRWLGQHRHAEPTFQPGQHLTATDQEELKPFLPVPLWEYYVYPDMDMEIAPTGVYPTPAEWGTSVTALDVHEIAGKKRS